jgi:membrane fusion protein (multidrug efflux system)
MQSSRSILIEADIPNDTWDLQAGLFAEAELVVDADARAISVPASAVSRFAGVEKVWTVVDGVAKQQAVRTGREKDGRVEIVDGLAAGDRVVQSAAEGHDGPVVVIESPPGKMLQAELPETGFHGGSEPAASAPQ